MYNDISVNKIFKYSGYEDMNCFHLAQDSSQWQALLSKIMDFRLP